MPEAEARALASERGPKANGSDEFVSGVGMAALPAMGAASDANLQGEGRVTVQAKEEENSLPRLHLHLCPYLPSLPPCPYLLRRPIWKGRTNRLLSSLIDILAFESPGSRLASEDVDGSPSLPIDEDAEG